MPEKATLERARKKAREGKSPSTQAGEFVREEFEHIREGKHGAKSAKQAIAIGLSKARRAGVKLPVPKGQSPKVQAQAKQDSAKGRSSAASQPSPKRSRATTQALQREGKQAASHAEISRQAHRSALRRGPAARSLAARKAVLTKGIVGMKKAAQKAARTRAARKG